MIDFFLSSERSQVLSETLQLVIDRLILKRHVIYLSLHVSYDCNLKIFGAFRKFFLVVSDNKL